MPGDRFHYINGTIFCEHDRPGAALLNSHLSPLQSNSVLTDQKVNKRAADVMLQSHLYLQQSVKCSYMNITVPLMRIIKSVDFPWGQWLPQQEMLLINKKRCRIVGKRLTTKEWDAVVDTKKCGVKNNFFLLHYIYLRTKSLVTVIVSYKLHHEKKHFSDEVDSTLQQ